MNLQGFTKTLWLKTKKHSPDILIGLGIAGMIGTTVMAVSATPKALTLIEEAKEGQSVEQLTPIETIKVAWKPYIPAVITGATSIACILGARSVNVRRNAALATAYKLSETALIDYKSKVLETFGEKKEQVVRDAIAKEKVEKNPVKSNEVIITPHGDTLCYDAYSSRYFKSDMEKLKRAENEVYNMLLNNGSVTLNDFYYEIGLDDTKVGNTLGWDTRHTPFRLSLSSQLASDGTPCIVVDFATAPTYEFYY